MQIWRPASVSDVFSIAASQPGSVRLVAGGTALQLDWAKGVAKPARLIDLSRIAALDGIKEEAGTIRIGANCSLSELVEEPVIAKSLPVLQMALGKVAGPTIRNLATIGGNVAGRTGCLLPGLLALDAHLEVATPTGIVCIKLEDWLSRPPEPIEVLIAILLTRQNSDSRSTFRKVGLRAAFSPSIINVAGILCLQAGIIVRARLAVGGGIVRPTRLRAVEAMLEGRTHATLDWKSIHRHLVEVIDAPDDPFRSSRYRRLVAANALVHGLGGTLPKVKRDRTVFPPQARQMGPEGEIELSHANHPHLWHERPDIAAKIAGHMPYLTDTRLPDMLVGRILRAGRPHARIVSIDTTAAESLAGVEAVVTHADIRGLNAFGIVIQDQPALCHDKVRYVGDPVAAVAAVDAATAEAALKLIKVTYEDLPPVTEPEEALSAGSASVHETGNLQCELHFARGDVEDGFQRANHIVEDVYVTPRQMHGFMETEGGYALVDEDGSLIVSVGGQHGSRDRMQLSRILDLPEDRIRVVTSPTGGAFGGKDELSVQPALALLALKTGKPVRLQLSRAESVIAGQKRNPMTIRMRTACDADGRLLAQEVDVLADAGAYASLGPGVLETALEHAAGPYLVDNVRTRGRLAYTNNGICGAFRGFGANQMTYAIECQMDRLARAVGIDPIEIRALNMRKPGMPGYLGQAVAPTERCDQMLAAASASPLWHAAQQATLDPAEWLIGTGMAMNYQGNGLGSVVPDPSGGRLALTPDGQIEGGFGLDEMGQGLLTLIKATVAAELGCAREDVKATVGDTRLAPESGSTTASRGTSVVWASVKMAAPQFSKQMRQAAASLLDRDPDGLVFAPGGFAERGSNSGEILITYRTLASRLPADALPSVTVAYEFPKNDYTAGNARFIFAFGACVARVAISRVTGEIRILDLNQHTAAGPVMDLAAYLGQIEGGAVQGLGFTLTEHMPMQDGHYLQANFDSYMMPGIADSPSAMRAFALESLDERDEHGPRGVGELGIGAVTPAIANAVAQALGQWPATSPFPPETILDMLEMQG